MVRILIVNKYWRMAGGVEVHAFEVRDLLERLGHTVYPFAMHEKDSLPAATEKYFPSETDFRAKTPRAAAKAVSRACLSTESSANLRKVVQDYDIEGAYVLHAYHQLGMGVLNTLSDLNVPTVLSLHDYKIGCPNYRLFSEKTGAICTKCVDRTNGHLWSPITEACWDGSSTAGAALTLEAIFTRGRQSYKKASVITTLNSLQESLVDKYAPGVPRFRVPHPVPLNPDREQPKEPQFVYVGRLVPEKGVDTIIRASAESGLPLRIIGDGRSASELQDLAKELDAPVEFLGQMPHSEIPELMRKSTALLVPSRWHEVSPLNVYEAIANDCPVAGSRVGGMVDQLGEDRGYLLDPDDASGWAVAMREIAEHPEKAAKKSHKAREHARLHLTVDKWETNIANAFAVAGMEITCAT